MNCKYKTSA